MNGFSHIEIILLDQKGPLRLVFGCFNLNLSSDSLFRVLSGLICLLECDLLSPQARFAALTVLLESKKRPESSVNFVTQKLLQDLAQNSNELVSNSRILIFKGRVVSSKNPWSHKMLHNSYCFKKFIKHIQNGKREYIRQNSASKMAKLENLPQPPPDQPDKEDSDDERTRLQKSAISSIIPDPEQFSSSDQDGEYGVILTSS